MIKNIEIDFIEGEEVQLRTEPGIKRIITGLVVRGIFVAYYTSKGDEETCHQGLELEKYSSKKAGFGK